jgi:hypothetical protein
MKHIKGNPKLKRYLRLRGLLYSNKRLIEVKDEVIESQAKMIDCQNEYIKQLKALLNNQEILISCADRSINSLKRDLDVAKRYADCFTEKCVAQEKIIEHIRFC